MFFKQRRAIQSAPNEYDKSTIVSIYPKEIIEEKPTIQPGVFKIPAGTVDKPGILVVGSSSWWRDIDPEQPLLEITVSSIRVAQSIVRDKLNAQFAASNEAQLGLFYLPQAFTAEDIKKNYNKLLLDADKKQRAWFQNLVKAADTLWSRSNANPRSISKDMKLAAETLGLKGKPWLADFVHAELVKCIACGNFNANTLVICPNCKVVLDKKKFEDLKLQFAS